MRSNIEDPEISCKGILTPSKMFIFSFVYDFFFPRRFEAAGSDSGARNRAWDDVVFARGANSRKKKDFCNLHNVLSPFF